MNVCHVCLHVYYVGMCVITPIITLLHSQTLERDLQSRVQQLQQELQSITHVSGSHSIHMKCTAEYY